MKNEKSTQILKTLKRLHKWTNFYLGSGVRKRTNELN